MSKSCTNCDAEITEGVGICDNCGMPVAEAALPQEAPPQEAPAQPPQTPLLAEESTPDHRWQLEQSEQRLPTSQSTLPGSALAQDQNREEQRRRVPRWVIRTAGFVGTVAAALVGTTAFWRRETDALAQNPTADSATQQRMGVSEAAVQDPVPIDQSEANPDPVDEIAPATAAPEPV